MNRVLVVSRQRLIGATNGSSAYLLDLARSARAAGFEPHLVQPSPGVMGRVPFYRARPEMAVFASQRIRGVLRFGRWFVARDPAVWRDAALGVLRGIARRLGARGAWAKDHPRPYAIAAPWTTADRAWLTNEVGAERWDAVIADYAFQSEAFALLGTPRAKSAIVMHDLFHARSGSGAGADADSVATIGREEELGMLARAGAVIAIQQEEADFVARELPAARVVLAPVTQEVAVDGSETGEAGRLLFVGSRTAPNSDGLRWFLDHVWPRVFAASPESLFDVVGSVCLDISGPAPKGVRLHGLVPDLAPFYGRAGIVVSPLRFGSGLKIKLVEALAQGKPVVASPVTLQGVANQCGAAVLEAETTEEFAAAILTLQRNPDLRAELSRQAIAAVEAHFTPEAAHGALREWLQDAAKGSAGAGTLLPPEARAAISCFQ